MHGFVKFPDGFPAARIQLEWEHYPKVAEGFVPRKPRDPDAPAASGRGGGGKPNSGGDDGGRGESLALSEEEVEPANVANNLAANILSQPSEGEVDNSRDGPSSEATVVSSTEAGSPADRGRTSDDERDDRARSMDGRSAPARSDERLRDDPTPTAERPEDLSVREARDAFPEDDGIGL